MRNCASELWSQKGHQRKLRSAKGVSGLPRASARVGMNRGVAAAFTSHHRRRRPPSHASFAEANTRQRTSKKPAVP
jgi:hypothetical protein